MAGGGGRAGERLGRVAAAGRWCGEAPSPLLVLETGALTALTAKYPVLVIVFKLKSLILPFPWK